MKINKLKNKSIALSPFQSPMIASFKAAVLTGVSQSSARGRRTGFNRLQFSTIQNNREELKKSDSDSSTSEKTHHKAVCIKRKAPPPPIPKVIMLCDKCKKYPESKLSLDSVTCDDCEKINQESNNQENAFTGSKITKRQGPHEFFFSKIGRNSKYVVKRQNSSKCGNVEESVETSSLETIKEKDKQDSYQIKQKFKIKRKAKFYKHDAK